MHAKPASNTLKSSSTDYCETRSNESLPSQTHTKDPVSPGRAEVCHTPRFTSAFITVTNKSEV